MPQDKALVHGLRKGSEACAQALVQQHYGEVLRYARHLCLSLIHISEPTRP